MSDTGGLVYGQGDATYQAVGGLEGITRLVNRFYDLMDSLPEAQTIRDMHPQDLSLSREKLICFLSGWMGGEKLFQQRFGPINIPRVHKHLPIDEQGRDMWLWCMKKALNELQYPEDLKIYLIEQLSFPAERIRSVCEPNIT
ncbi:group II truncated hemoglobin [Sessilibacter corallicola]|uniref:Globin n=1 Tax=Sessilibacter corallicola TaxID=2904075 RepID=A0ABQ0AB45_9GAMM